MQLKLERVRDKDFERKDYLYVPYIICDKCGKVIERDETNKPSRIELDPTVAWSVFDDEIYFFHNHCALNQDDLNRSMRLNGFLDAFHSGEGFHLPYYLRHGRDRPLPPTMEYNILWADATFSALKYTHPITTQRKVVHLAAVRLQRLPILGFTPKTVFTRRHP